MESTLVVVTCIRDLLQLQVLFFSIQKYLSPCKIIIVVNEEECNIPIWDRWYNNNKHFLDNHNVQIYTREDLLPDDVPSWHTSAAVKARNPEWATNSGWTTQNILKICVAEKVTTPEYILLDSKNFFIKPTVLSDIKRHANRSYFDSFNNADSYSYMWAKDWILAIAAKLNKPITPIIDEFGKIKLRGTGTPYTFTTKYALALLKYFGGISDFNKWFLTTILNQSICFRTTGRDATNGFPLVSEFLLYDIFCKVELNVDEGGTVDTNAWVLWTKENVWNYPPIEDIPANVHVGGIHRFYIAESTEQEIESIYRYFGLSLMECGPAGKAAVC